MVAHSPTAIIVHHVEALIAGAYLSGKTPAVCGGREGRGNPRHGEVQTGRRFFATARWPEGDVVRLKYARPGPEGVKCRCSKARAPRSMRANFWPHFRALGRSAAGQRQTEGERRHAAVLGKTVVHADAPLVPASLYVAVLDASLYRQIGAGGVRTAEAGLGTFVCAEHGGIGAKP